MEERVRGVSHSWGNRIGTLGNTMDNDDGNDYHSDDKKTLDKEGGQQRIEGEGKEKDSRIHENCYSEHKIDLTPSLQREKKEMESEKQKRNQKIETKKSATTEITDIVKYGSRSSPPPSPPNQEEEEEEDEEEIEEEKYKIEKRESTPRQQSTSSSNH